MWTEGYVSGIDYTHGYYGELSPQRLRLAALAKGYHVAEPENLNYLELGYGQGLSVNIHAASTPGEFWGNDFNPSHCANAVNLANASGSGLRALDDSFQELANRKDLPQFDIIALHGIWSWISDENRRVIVDIAKRKLKPGGMFYVSYNVTPGWAPAMPLRHLLAQHADKMGSGSITTRIDDSIGFAQKVMDSGAMYFKANPGITDRLSKLKDQNKNYVAHEYFNSDWHPMPFSQTAELLGDAKLTFAAPAHPLDHIDIINLTTEAQKVLKEISDSEFKQTVRDFFVNQQFRRDVFIKGGLRLAPLEMSRRLQAMRFVLIDAPDNLSKSVTGSLGEADLHPDIYQPIVKALASDNMVPKTPAELQISCGGLDFPTVFQALMILTGANMVAPAQNDRAVKSALESSKALNAELCRRAEVSAEVSFLASPVTGAGVSVGRIEHLFLRANDLKVDNVIHYIWALLKSQGQSMVKDGNALEGDEANQAELQHQLDKFVGQRLPVLRALNIA